jgi:DNA-binding NarL/FixJ family response regulator
MTPKSYSDVALTIEEVRKHARILVIDDHTFPAEKTFTRDGYHVERWPYIKNLSQLTDGHYQLILLDVQGVGMTESPDKQGLGILEHIKKTNPAQAVILYSSDTYSVSSSRYIMLADAFLDKSSSYVEYKDEVDRLLMTQSSPGYFISRMNQQLGTSATMVPKAVRYANSAFRNGNTTRLERYLRANLSDATQVDTALRVVSVGISIISLFLK